jgi:hypothetical protein
MVRLLLCTFIVCLLASAALGAEYQWRSFPDDRDQVSLWRDGQQLGNYRFSTHTYYPRLAPDVWGEPCAPPYPPPGRDDGLGSLPARVEPDGTINFGLDLSRIAPAGKHILNGAEVSKQALLEALGEPKILDDSRWLCLTIIGPDAARQRVLDDLQSAAVLAPWRGRIKVQDYPPDHWAVRDAGFVCDGEPTIYCQAPDGQVLHRQNGYRGPEALAEVLRKADPSYRPEKDPDLNRPLANVPLWVWIGGAVLLVLLLKGDKK